MKKERPPPINTEMVAIENPQVATPVVGTPVTKPVETMAVSPRTIVYTLVQ